MQRTRVKICGITRVEDAVYAAQLGADSIGLVFHQKSPRFIDLDSALKIKKALPAFVTITALMMDESQAWVDEIVQRLNPDCLQFHGDECPDDCSRYNIPYIKAIAMSGMQNVTGYMACYPEAQGFLLDSHAAGEQGGSGKAFDWMSIPQDLRHQIILAGGITPDNVYDAITQISPWAVDLSSGVEQSKGIKDQAKMHKLMSEVTRANNN
ncbi:MAG: phosphoribosylanthranilate isomerase [Gammaproteobacteria bacterium]|nr:phosphoribosylanthranilate isomerase [Gammaproteobacteria bacterium]